MMDNDDDDGVPTTEEMREMLLELKAREVLARENQKFLVEFIDAYRGFPCLWQYGCKDYRNRHVKNRAYDVLVKKMKEIDPSASRNSVIKKINALRTAFRREYKKVRQSMAIAAAGAKTYSPSLWYYDLLSFVVDQQDQIDPPPDVTLSEWQHSTDDEDEAKEQDDDADGLAEYLQNSIIPEPAVKIEPLSPSSSSGGSSPTPPKATNTSMPIANLEINSICLENDATSTNGKAEDGTPRLKRTHYEAFPSTDLDRFGLYVAAKLKRSSRKQSVIAEKVIAEVLMRANLGTLEETTTLTESTLAIS